MPWFDVPVKIETYGSMRIESSSAASAADLVNCIDVIDANYEYDVTDAPELDLPTHYLTVAGDATEAKESGE